MEELTTNAVLATKLDYISKDISSIKKDVADIKSDNITRREFETHVKDSEDKVRARFQLSDQKMEEVSKDSAWNTKIIYGVLTLVLGSIVTAVMRLLIR
jgi:hypothetical protein